MSWQVATIGGREADIFEPSQPSEQGFVVVFLHGHGGEMLVDKPAFTAELERHRLRCVCPSGGQSWWLDLTSAEFPQTTALRHVVDDVLTWVQARWGIEPPAVGLFGVSMGGQGALQVAYRHPLRFPVVAAISPIVDFHLVYGEGLPLDAMFPNPEAARQETVVLQLRPLNWPKHQLIVCDPTDTHWYEGAERLVMKLRSSGVPVETDFETTGGGHTWEYFNHMAAPVLQFLAERLDKERRRVR